ncbi:MAG: VOC family protein [Anaerolineales bacterium]|jgi:predicted enzyme related to lactoylglutathione lyase
MISKVIRITLVVRDQEEAFQYYTETLGLEKRADFPLSPGRRWLTIAPKDQEGLEIVLQPSDWFEGAEREQHAAMVGKNPTIVFSVDDCRQTYTLLQGRGVKFDSPPEDLPYGIQAVAKDLYGNDLVLLEPRE